MMINRCRGKKRRPVGRVRYQSIPKSTLRICSSDGKFNSCDGYAVDLESVKRLAEEVAKEVDRSRTERQAYRESVLTENISIRKTALNSVG